MRWATVATGAVLATPELPEQPGTVAATAALLAYTTWRTLRPLPRSGATDINPATVALDLAVAWAAVAASGGWDSPYVFTLLVGILLAGFWRGYAGAFAAAGAAAAGLALAALVIPSARASPEAATQVVLVYTATGALAGYARRLFLEAEERHEAFADRMARLTEANALLSQLTRVAQTLPSSLDLGNTLAAAMGHLRQLFDFSGAAILVHNPATGSWRPEAVAGLPAPPTLRTAELPEPASTAAAELHLVTDRLDPGAGRSGLWARSRSGLYGPLVARGRVVALVALEHTEPERFSDREAEVMAGLSAPLALAIDNALWFERLRTLGAEGERDRLARGLHDRIGQGLAYVGLELDRLSRHPEPGEELVRLRQEVATLLAEVRETLRQLRSRVTETTGLAELAGDYLARFSEQTGIAVRFTDHAGGERLPVPMEQELWRILQEGLSNVERHSGAAGVEVTWTVRDGHARIEIGDDGRGFDPTGLEEDTPSGVMAMRERAQAVGARLTIDSQPGRGTRLAVDVEVEG